MDAITEHELLLINENIEIAKILNYAKPNPIFEPNNILTKTAQKDNLSDNLSFYHGYEALQKKAELIKKRNIDAFIPQITMNENFVGSLMRYELINDTMILMEEIGFEENNVSSPQFKIMDIDEYYKVDEFSQDTKIIITFFILLGLLGGLFVVFIIFYYDIKKNKINI